MVCCASVPIPQLPLSFCEPFVNAPLASRLRFKIFNPTCGPIVIYETRRFLSQAEWQDIIDKAELSIDMRAIHARASEAAQPKPTLS